MIEKVVIGIKVKEDGLEEVIDVYFKKDDGEREREIFYNEKNEILEKRDIIVYIVDDKIIIETHSDVEIMYTPEEIGVEFHKAMMELKIQRQSQEEDSEDEEESDDNSVKPYNPLLIRVEPKQFTIENTVSKIEKEEIDLNPDFQRKFVWTDITRKSRLIESILLRIPLPMFYLAQDEDGIYHVLDGLQRLTVLESYFKNEFRLKNLEYLSDCEGKFFENKKVKSDKNLEGKYVRRIKDTMLHFNVVDSGTPEQAKYDIFRRINTGGKPLNRQEMRNAMASKDTRKLLHSLANLTIFKKATGYSVKDTRFADQELVLRFIGFYLIDNDLPKAKHYSGNMASFLDDIIEILNKYYSHKVSFCEKLTENFQKSMENAYQLFEDRAFKRKTTRILNKALFLSLSRISYHYELDEKYDVNSSISFRENLSEENDMKIKLENYDKKLQILDEALSKGTNEVAKIDTAYRIMKEIMEVIVKDEYFYTRD